MHGRKTGEWDEEKYGIQEMQGNKKQYNARYRLFVGVQISLLLEGGSGDGLVLGRDCKIVL